MLTFAPTRCVLYYALFVLTHADDAVLWPAEE